METKNKFIKLEHWQKVSLMLAVYDVIVVNLSYALALWLRFDCRYSNIPPIYINTWLRFVPVYTVVCLLVFWFMKLYQSIWQFASYTELYRIIKATAVTVAFHILAITLLFRSFPISYYIIGALFQFIFVLGIRFSYRFFLLLKTRIVSGSHKKRVMIVGAGASGQMIIRDIQAAKEIEDEVVCVIDDNPNKWNRYIDGVPVVGGRDEIMAACDKYSVDKIYIAIPSASAEQKRDILNICNATKCELKQLPGMYQLVTGQITVSNLKKVSVEDLLGRDPIRADLTEVFEFINGKRVLVTGGGGSIGSELCRQIASHHPEMLIIFDIYENNAYSIQLELKEKYPNLNLVTLIGSVRDSRKIFSVFQKYKPQIVYHAAAHKHVPLMEDSPCEAIKNNAIGTYKTAYAAMVNQCERFVLISTDKAVNPTNIMGASKRLCEMVIQSFDTKIKAGQANEIPQLFTHEGVENADKDGTGSVFKNIRTEFVAVRFGNVLGSNGSVIPIFRKQIEKGGPVTVTHPDIIRYFMTIPEAVSLVLLAGTPLGRSTLLVTGCLLAVRLLRSTLARRSLALRGRAGWPVSATLRHVGGDGGPFRRYGAICRRRAIRAHGISRRRGPIRRRGLDCGCGSLRGFHHGSGAILLL